MESRSETVLGAQLQVHGGGGRTLQACQENFGARLIFPGPDGSSQGGVASGKWPECIRCARISLEHNAGVANQQGGPSGVFQDKRLLRLHGQRSVSAE